MRWFVAGTLGICLTFLGSGCRQQAAITGGGPKASVAESKPKTGEPEQMLDGKPISAWVADLKSQDSEVRRSSALVLGTPEAKAAVEPLCDLLKDPETKVRRAAALALGGIGPEAQIAVMPLIALLKDPDGMVRGAVADALGKIGPNAKDAVPALTELYQGEKSILVKTMAGEALKKLDAEAAKKAGVE